MGSFFSMMPYLPSDDEAESPSAIPPPTPTLKEAHAEPLEIIAPEPEAQVVSIFTNPAPAPVVFAEFEAPPDHSLLSLSLSKDESGIPLYTLSVNDQRVCFFVPSSHKIIEKHRKEILLTNFVKGEIYHVSALTYSFIGEVKSLSALTRRKYIDRRSFVCEDTDGYRQLILPGLILGCRVRDYEQRCATVIQMGELALSMPKQRGWMSGLKLKTAGGETFIIDIKKIIKDEEDKRWIVLCHEPREPLPSSVRQGCHLEIVNEDYDEKNWQSAVTGALFVFHSNKNRSVTAKPIDNWPLLERIYGVPGHCDFPATNNVDLSIPLKNGGSLKLNHQQAEAVSRYNSSSVPAFAIEAPPGSGKTLTAAAMAVSYCGEGIQLFLSTANIPVNNMALALAKLDYGHRKPLHFVSAEGEERMADQNTSPFSALSLAKNQEELRQKIELLEHMEIEEGPREKELKKNQAKALWEACSPVLNERHDIYFATIDTILKRRVKPNKNGYHYEDEVKKQLENEVERVVIDEASQLSEAALNAIVLCFPKAQIVLIGDSKQLAPFKFKSGDVVSELAYRSALDVVKDKSNDPIIKLHEVYRASASLIAHYSDVFYDGRLKSSKKERENPLGCFAKRGAVKEERACLFWKVKYGRCEMDGTSKINEREITALCHIVKQLRKAKIYEKDVMIISMYEAQRKKAVKALKKNWSGYEVLTVDSAQGREKRIVIVLTTRTSVPAEAGEEFFNSPKRCNVAVSRHQDALIVLGHPSIEAAPNRTQVLSTKYFNHFEDNNGRVPGSA